MNIKSAFLSPSQSLFKRIDVVALGLALIGALWGIKQRSGLPAVPLLEPDSWGYLKPVLSWLKRRGISADLMPL
jgi:hypothetical protein